MGTSTGGIVIEASDGYALPPKNCCGASSAELYDPSTNTWSFTSPVLTGVEHTATLLAGGDVLITGGKLEPINMYELSNAAIYASSYPPDEPHTTNPALTTVLKITNAAQSHKTWREGIALAHSTTNRSKLPIGTTFSFALNEQANISLVFTQQTGGRKSNGKCVAQAKQNHHKPTCKRTVTAGTLSLAGHSGTNKVVFQGRISRSKKLKQGRYTLLVTANSNGVLTASKLLSFTIVK